MARVALPLPYSPMMSGWSHIDRPPTPCKGMVWRANSNSLLYNMRDLRGAIIIIIINPWYEREAGAPVHSFQHRRYAS